MVEAGAHVLKPGGTNSGNSEITPKSIRAPNQNSGLFNGNDSGFIDLLAEDLLLQVYGYSNVSDVLTLAKVNKHNRTSIINHLGKREEIFYLRNKTIRDKEFKALFSGIGLFSKIKKLDLSGSKFNFEMLAYLPKDLKYLSLNSVTNSNNNRFGDVGAQAIAQSEHMSKLTHLDFSFFP